MDDSGAPTIHDASIRALLAVKAGQRWSVAATSEPIPLGAALRHGEHRVLTDLRFPIPRPTRVALADAWIVFAIEGTTTGRITGAHRVQTFACATRNLTGTSMAASERAERLRRDYLSAC